MKLLSSLVSLLAMSTATLVNASTPFGQPVNCRDDISYRNVYAGPVQCNASYQVQSCVPKPAGFDIITQTINDTLYGNSPATTRTTMNLYKMVTFKYSEGVGPNACSIPVDRTRELACTATIPFSHQEQIVKNICDYKPEARLAYSAGYRAVDVMGFSRDYDGTIVSEQLWVDGVLQSGASITLEGYPGQAFSVTITATDNHGYTDTKSQTVVIPQNSGGPKKP